jgi:hypothetical protein
MPVLKATKKYVYPTNQREKEVWYNLNDNFGCFIGCDEASDIRNMFIGGIGFAKKQNGVVVCFFSLIGCNHGSCSNA